MARSTSGQVTRFSISEHGFDSRTGFHAALAQKVVAPGFHPGDVSSILTCRSTCARGGIGIRARLRPECPSRAWEFDSPRAYSCARSSMDEHRITDPGMHVRIVSGVLATSRKYRCSVRSPASTSSNLPCGRDARLLFPNGGVSPGSSPGRGALALVVRSDGRRSSKP